MTHGRRHKQLSAPFCKLTPTFVRPKCLGWRRHTLAGNIYHVGLCKVVPMGGVRLQPSVSLRSCRRLFLLQTWARVPADDSHGGALYMAWLGAPVKFRWYWRPCKQCQLCVQTWAQHARMGGTRRPATGCIIHEHAALVAIPTFPMGMALRRAIIFSTSVAILATSSWSRVGRTRC